MILYSIVASVFPTMHFMRTCTHVLGCCTQEKELESVKFALTSCSLGSQLAQMLYVIIRVMHSIVSSSLLRMHSESVSVGL